MNRVVTLAVIASAAFGAGCTRGPADERLVLLDTSRSAEPAPETFRVRFETTKGPFVIQAHHAWAPWGVDRFYYLVKNGYYDSASFFRVLPGYIAQFGINGNPAIAGSWRTRIFPDDTTQHQSNLRGRVTFANAGPNSRATQIFINLRNNPDLDRNYAPFAEIVEGIDVIDKLYSGYGDGEPSGRGPDQGRIFNEGTPYLKRGYPNLDYIITARIVQ